MKIWYKEFLPSLLLQQFVDCFWYQTVEEENGSDSPTHKCLPLGMLEIIFQVEEANCYVDIDGTWQRLPDAFVVGIYKDVVRLKTKGKSRKFGMRLKPESLLRLFKIPAAALFNNYTDLDTFFGKKLNVLADQIAGTREIDALINIAESFLRDHLRDLETERNYLAEATHLIRESKGNLTMEELTGNLYISERQLQRSFKDTYGTSPKTYQRIIRFRNAYAFVQQSKTGLSWTDVTYSFGYSDQAHFIRDFKEFTGDVPTTVIENGHQFYQMNGALAS